MDSGNEPRRCDNRDSITQAKADVSMIAAASSSQWVMTYQTPTARSASPATIKVIGLIRSCIAAPANMVAAP
nr:hypothetical protein [Escherichia coli]